MIYLRYAIAVCGFAAAMSPALACYTVYGPANQVLYTGAEPPIDMSYQIHQRLPAVFPGGHMVYGNSTDCTLMDSRAVRAGFAGGMAFASATSTAPAAVSRQRAQSAR